MFAIAAVRLGEENDRDFLTAHPWVYRLGGGETRAIVSTARDLALERRSDVLFRESNLAGRFRHLLRSPRPRAESELGKWEFRPGY